MESVELKSEEIPASDMVEKSTEIADDSQEMSLKDIHHNMKVNIGLDAIFISGGRDVEMVTGPLYVFLGASNSLIGLLGSLSIISLIGSILSPFISRKFAYKKWYLFLSHIPYIGAWGLMGLVLLLSQHFGMKNTELLWWIFGLSAANMFFAGFVTLPHQEYLAACIPMNYRGRYSGFSVTVGSIGALASSALAAYILLHVQKPMAFGYLFLCAWFLCQASFILALFGRERRTPIEKSPKPWTKKMLIEVWKDKKFLRVLLSNSLFQIIIWSAMSFIPIYGYRELHMIPATAATIAICQQIIRSLLTSPIGILTDKIGPKRVLPFWMLFAALTFIPILVLRNPLSVYISATLSALCYSGIYASFIPLTYGIPAPENRAGHFSVQTLQRNASDAVGMLMTGVLCDFLGYRSVFIISLAVAVALYFFSKWLLAPLSENAQDYA